MTESPETTNLQFSREKHVLALTTGSGTERVLWSWEGNGYNGEYNPDDPADEPLLTLEALRRTDNAEAWEEPPEGGTIITRFSRNSPEALKKGALILVLDWLQGKLEAGVPVQATLGGLITIAADNHNVIDMAVQKWPEDFSEMFDWLIARNPESALRLVQAICYHHQYQPDHKTLEPLLQLNDPVLRKQALKLSQHVSQSNEHGRQATP